MCGSEIEKKNCVLQIGNDCMFQYFFVVVWIQKRLFIYYYLDAIFFLCSFLLFFIPNYISVFFLFVCELILIHSDKVGFD